MRILFLTHYFPPEVNAPATRTYEHAKEWVKDENTEVTVITNNPNHPEGVLYEGYENRWFQKEEIDGIEVIRVKTYTAANKGFLKRTINYLFYMLMAIVTSFRVGKKDVVIATSPQFFCACGGYFVSLLKRVPFVFELRDIWPESIVTVGAMKKNFMIRFFEKVELFLYKNSALIIALTDSFKENLIKRGIDAKKITVIKNGVDLDNFKKEAVHKVTAGQSEQTKIERSEIPRIGVALGKSRRIGTYPKFRKEPGVFTSFTDDFSLWEEKKIISYIGTLGMAHALDKVLDCAKNLQTMEYVQFLIVGSGAERDELENKKKKEDIKNVTFVGQVNKEEVKKYYAISDIGLVTLRKSECFKSVIPSKIFEYMAMEVPIIISVDGEARQIVEESQGGIYAEPENVEQMTEVLRVLIQKPETMAEMGKNARMYVKRNFDRKELAQKQLDVLKSLVSTG